MCDYYIFIVGKGDNPVYETEYSTRQTPSFENRHLPQLIAHSSLDLVDEYLFSPNSTNQMYLKAIDKFNQYLVNAFVGASSVKFLLLHDAEKIEENNLRRFFNELYELYAKFALNPLYDIHSPIKSISFNKKVHLLAKKYLA